MRVAEKLPHPLVDGQRQKGMGQILPVFVDRKLDLLRGSEAAGSKPGM